METKESFSLTLERNEGYEFETRFDKEEFGVLITDEPSPLGAGKGPNPSRILGLAVGNCLSASLLFCLEKSKVTVNSLSTEVKGYLERNEKKLLRIQKMEADIKLDVSKEDQERISRCLGLFEDYCVVTASVSKGIQVDVRVSDADGKLLYENADTE